MERHTILNSWKEIAVYMGRAVRTVQRWERECDFPVHRPRGKKRSAVFALSREIDTWLENCPQSVEDVNHDLADEALSVQHRTLDENVPNNEARKALPLQQAMMGAQR
jgi:hypothetical protein